MADTTFTDDVTLVVSAWLNEVNDQVYKNAGVCYLTSVAGTNTVTGTSSPVQSAYKARQVFWLIPANTNTGATTLNVSSLGAKNVYYEGAACSGGEFKAGVPVAVLYDGTQFNVVSFGVSRGTFTPGIAFGGGTTGITYTTQNGTYTRVGNLVVCRGYIVMSAKGSSTGTATVTGLPFTINNTSSANVTSAIYADRLASVSGGYQGISLPNTTTIGLEYTGTGSSTAMQDTNFNNNTIIGFSISYQI